LPTAYIKKEDRGKEKIILVQKYYIASYCIALHSSPLRLETSPSLQPGAPGHPKKSLETTKPSLVWFRSQVCCVPHAQSFLRADIPQPAYLEVSTGQVVSRYPKWWRDLKAVGKRCMFFIQAQDFYYEE